MVDVGYDRKDLEPLLPPPDVAQTVDIPRCRFNIQMGRYESIPSEFFVQDFSRGRIGSRWEAPRVLIVHRMLAPIVSTAKLQESNRTRVDRLDSSWRESCDGLRFHTRDFPGMLEVD